MKYLFFIILLIVSSSIYAQENEAELLTQLETSHGKKRVKILLELLKINTNKTGNKAIKYALQAKDEIMNYATDALTKSAVFNQLGIEYFKLGNFKEALKYLESGYQTIKLTDQKEAIISTVYNMGKVYSQMSLHGKAAEAYTDAMNRAIEAKDVETAFNACIEASNSYSGMNKYVDAFNTLKNVIRILNWKYNEKSGAELKSIELEKEKLLADNKKKEEEISLVMSKLHFTEEEKKKLSSDLEMERLEKEKADLLRRQNELETKFEKEKNEQLILNNKIKSIANRKLEKRLSIIIIAATICLALALLLLYLSQRMRKKNRLLEEQNIKIETQNAEIRLQRDQILLKNNEIAEKSQNLNDSIRYAKRIQTALLPTNHTMKTFFPKGYFVIYEPKHQISGDFYWLNEKDGKIILAAADCTGHGVPGAFISMLGISSLNHIVFTKGTTSPSQILNELRQEILDTFPTHDKADRISDGMDIVLIVIDKEKQTITFSGANNPLYLVRGHEIIPFKTDKMPVGYHRRMDDFSEQTFDYKKYDQLYLFSDGFVDQIGGPEEKKFMYPRFRDLLLSVNDKYFESQQSIMWEKFSEWKGEFEQLDDVMVLGICLS